MLHFTFNILKCWCCNALPSIFAVGDPSENKNVWYIKEKVMTSSKAVVDSCIAELKYVITGFCLLSVTDR
jgi:hypothetical protein